MKKLILFLLISFSFGAASAQDRLTTIILVRHAEKGNDGTKDPDLNAAGIQRAGALLEFLKQTELDAIYSTEYKRTVNTVQKVAVDHQLKLTSYKPFDLESFTKQLMKEAGKTILVVGHSNTIPNTINALIGEEKYQQLDDADYDNLYVVTVSEGGEKVKVLEFQYGSPSGI